MSLARWGYNAVEMAKALADGEDDVSYRTHANKPTAALWALVALADVMLLLASAGVVLLVSLASVGAVAGVGFVAWRYTRRQVAPIPVGSGRRRLD
jgi:hypothetical protein